MATKTDYTRKCQQLDVLIDLLERENKRLKAKHRRNWRLAGVKPPNEYHQVCLVTMNGNLQPYTDKATWFGGKWYQIEYTADGYPRKIDITDAVIAWQPLPEPYKESEVAT